MTTSRIVKPLHYIVIDFSKLFSLSLDTRGLLRNGKTYPSKILYQIPCLLLLNPVLNSEKMK